MENIDINRNGSVCVNIYADEIQRVKSIVTGEEWVYMAAIYEMVEKPILSDLIFTRYRKDKIDWRNHIKGNNSRLHWHDVKNDNCKKNIIERWLNYILKDCKEERKFYFSLLGLNLSNLNLAEFGDKQNFNSVYNRFFRSMVAFSLKKFFKERVTIVNIFHEIGQQIEHEYFDWHTVLKLDEFSGLNTLCTRIKFLSKSHLEDEKSNVIQLCDILLGIFKDIHLGINWDTYPFNKRFILNSNFVQKFLIDRLIKNPNNINSDYGYSKRFNISLFPKTKSKLGSLDRKLNNYYDISRLKLGYEHSCNQGKLF